MGYESKLYIGELHEAEDVYVEDENAEDGSGYPKDENGDLIPTGKKERWLNIFGMIDLCKCGSESKWLKIVSEFSQEIDENVYPFIFEEGDIQIKEDKYGDKLIPVPLEEVLIALKDDNKRGNYRRFKWAIAMIESILDGYTDRTQCDLVALHYGH